LRRFRVRHRQVTKGRPRADRRRLRRDHFGLVSDRWREGRPYIAQAQEFIAELVGDFEFLPGDDSAIGSSQLGESDNFHRKKEREVQE
jgi:hypothetical protein